MMSGIDSNVIIIGLSTLFATIIIVVAAIMAAKCDSAVATKALECMARQPEQAAQLQITMLIAIGLVESIPIIAAVIAIVLVMANPFIK